MHACLREEGDVAKVGRREEHEGEQEPDEHVGTERAENRLVGDPLVVQHADERDRQGRGHEERNRQQVGEADDRARVDEEHERREENAREDRGGLNAD